MCEQVRDLEAQNGSLRHNLSSYSDTTRMLMDSQNLDGLTKSELAAKYGSLASEVLFTCVTSSRSVDVTHFSDTQAEVDWTNK